MAARKTLPPSPQQDALADLIAEGATFAEAVVRMGISRARVGQLWRRICVKLGEQAR